MRFAILAPLMLLAGCVDTDASINLMKGQGSAFTAPNGQRSFRYVVPENVYRGVIDDAATLRKQHDFLIGQWASTGCPGGYSVSSRDISQGMVIYSGPCR
jgi:hypothetical protein